MWGFSATPLPFPPCVLLFRRVPPPLSLPYHAPRGDVSHASSPPFFPRDRGKRARTSSSAGLRAPIEGGG